MLLLFTLLDFTLLYHQSEVSGGPQGAPSHLSLEALQGSSQTLVPFNQKPEVFHERIRINFPHFFQFSFDYFPPILSV